MSSANFPQMNKLKTEDSAMIKDHYHIVTIKGNQVEIVPAEGGKSQVVYIADVKYILPADTIIAKLPNYNKFGCKTKLRLNPQNIPDLNWELATTANTTHYNS